MTRIHILSDIHDDYSRDSLGNFRIPEVDADVIVVAGDIAGRISKMGRSWLEAQNRGIPIVVVLGNHDYWRANLDTEVSRYRSLASVDWIHILDGEAIELAGARFVGATLWTDYKIYDPVDTYRAQLEALQSLSDFRYIRQNNGQDRVFPVNIANEHERQKAAIDAILAVPYTGPTVVVTHHAPSRQSLMDPNRIQALDAAYASDLEAMIVQRQPELWIHGHVHTPRDYMVGETRVVCNPRGYRHIAHAMTKATSKAETEVVEFNDRLVIDVQRKPRLDQWGMPQSYETELMLHNLERHQHVQDLIEKGPDDANVWKI